MYVFGARASLALQRSTTESLTAGPLLNGLWQQHKQNIMRQGCSREARQQSSRAAQVATACVRQLACIGCSCTEACAVQYGGSLLSI